MPKPRIDLCVAKEACWLNIAPISPNQVVMQRRRRFGGRSAVTPEGRKEVR